MYKDKDKQREANRQASQRRRDKGMTQGMTNEGMMPQGMTHNKLVGHDVLNPVTKMCAAMPDGTTDISVVKALHKMVKPERTPKRGKDIKCFGDLPMDVQNSINNYSMGKDGIDQVIKANRTAIAIKYQHLFPGRYHSTGVA